MWSAFVLTIFLTGTSRWRYTLSLSTTHILHPRRTFLIVETPKKITRCFQNQPQRQRQLNRYVGTTLSSNTARCAVDNALGQPSEDTKSSSDGEILSPEYYKSVYDTDDPATTTTTDNDNDDNTNPTLNSQTPWDIGRAQPTIA